MSASHGSWPARGALAQVKSHSEAVVGGDRSPGGGCMVGAGPKWSAGCALQGLIGNHLKCVGKSSEGFRQRGDMGTFAFSESLWLLSGCQTSEIRSGHREGWGGGGWRPGGQGGDLDHERWWDTEEGRDSFQPCPDLRAPHAQAHVETWLSQFPSVRSDQPPMALVRHILVSALLQEGHGFAAHSPVQTQAPVAM